MNAAAFPDFLPRSSVQEQEGYCAPFHSYILCPVTTSVRKLGPARADDFLKEGKLWQGN